MTILTADTWDRHRLSLSNRIGWWDVETRCTVIVAAPAQEPQLWDDYLEGAYRSYRRHGVERVLDLDAVRGGRDTRLFYAAIGEDGNVVGGTRISKPLRSAEESVAVAEWAGQRGLKAVRALIADRLPFGVVEGKTAWVDANQGQRGALFRMLVRTAPLTLHLLNVRFLLSTGAAHVLENWRSSGGKVASHIPAAPYPDDRYQTKLIWWDRSTIANDVAPQQLAQMKNELREVIRQAERLGGVTTATSGAGSW